ncbi:hypothetical protein RMATCC62417_07822 [Rhizopus microsporus]|nr:hypothetical protein RMATCC62417_07822 [Rhizopus microsporus]
MENNNNQSTTSCSSCHTSLPVDSCNRTCQACRERVAASCHRCRAEDQHKETDAATRPRGRPSTVESSDAEGRPRGRPRAEPAAYISQLSRLRLLDLGRMDKECPHCHTLHWIDERQETLSLSNQSWESCCKRESVQLQLLPDPPQNLKDLLASTDTQGRHFKDNLCQYSAAFAFTSLGCNIVSAEDRANNNNNRGGLNAFQIHGAFCHRHGPLIPVEGNEPSYVQLYIFDPSYAAEIRQVRDSNLDPKITRELSVMLAQCNLFARVYYHAHEILSSHESDSNNDQTKTNAPYINISPSMRMHLIEGGDRRTHDLPTMEEVAAVIPTEFIDGNFRDIVFTLRSNSRNDSLRQGYVFEQGFQHISHTHATYVCMNCVLSFPHGACG